jgi:hypothetical protein
VEADYLTHGSTWKQGRKALHWGRYWKEGQHDDSTKKQWDAFPALKAMGSIAAKWMCERVMGQKCNLIVFNFICSGQELRRCVFLFGETCRSKPSYFIKNLVVFV